jgi:flagellar assembly protein FliH
MAKAVFRPGEVTISETKVFLEPPGAVFGPDSAAVVEEIGGEDEGEETYSGPTAEELRQEAELFKSRWDAEKEGMLQAARDEADRIIKEAEDAAFQEVKRKTDQAQAARQAAQDEADALVAAARQQAAEIEAEARKIREAGRREAEEQGREAGREAGFNEGRDEAARLVERSRVVLERAQEKRGEILAETEQQVIDLVLLIARKVVKVISENQSSVIKANVVQALRKVKGKGSVIIRVNTADLQLTTGHIKEFIQILEGNNTIQVAEDSSVDPGGCVIETDFGEIDARIASQLAELETKIREIAPIKTRAKAAPGPREG